MDIPLISKFACGYVQGAKSVNPNIRVIQNMTGTTPSAWNDPVRGAEITRSQISQGADVVYHAAGGTGIGVLQAAADANIFGIGVDSNQNHLFPGKILTSMLKRVDVAVYDAFTEGSNLTTGVQVLGLKENGVGYAVDEHNENLLSRADLRKVRRAERGIRQGRIDVHDYTATNSCNVR